MSRGITEISTPKIRNFLKNKGAAMVGVAPIRSVLTDERYEHLIHDACPSADCVIVFGTTFPQSTLDACPENPRPARYTLHALYAEGEQICLLLSRLLESHGYRGVIIPAYLPVEMSYNTMGMKGDVNLKLAAVEAGLGSRGVSDLLITPEFGPRVRLFGVISDAPLKPTPKLDHDVCTSCGKCLTACPSGAISFNPKSDMDGVDSGCDPRVCAPYSMKNGLPTMLKHIQSISEEKVPEKRLKMAKGMQSWKLWQALSQGSFYECFECLRVCPVGKIQFKKT